MRPAQQLDASHQGRTAHGGGGAVTAYRVSVSEELIGADDRCASSATFAKALAAVDSIAVDALRMEDTGVTRADVERLVQVGLLSAGQGTWAPAQMREAQERLAAASGSLWFVLAQHRSPAEAAASTSNAELRDRFAPGLADGSMLGAVSFAHLRRAHPSVVATRVGGGWQITGRLDWITSWGLADVLLLMAETESGEVVQALLPAAERPGLTITGSLSLAAMRGTHTVGAALDGLQLTDGEVAAVMPKSEWLTVDGQRTSNTPPAVIGLARAAINSILTLASDRSWLEALTLARQWSEELQGARGRAYELVDDVEPAALLEERLALRGQLTKLAQDATAVAVAVHAGRAMLASSAEQRWAREAMFALVQAQTPVTRDALLASYRATN
jgi:alkylation response protein AidB-like acyl-CoA dehydrogenase